MVNPLDTAVERIGQEAKLAEAVTSETMLVIQCRVCDTLIRRHELITLFAHRLREDGWRVVPVQEGGEPVPVCGHCLSRMRGGR